jgi:hypothetical protein
VAIDLADGLDCIENRIWSWYSHRDIISAVEMI